MLDCTPAAASPKAHDRVRDIWSDCCEDFETAITDSELVGPTPDSQEDEDTFYDAESRPPIKLLGLLNGKPVKMLIDSGASGNYIASSCIKRQSLACKSTAERYAVKLPDGTDLLVHAVLSGTKLKLDRSENAPEHRVALAVIDMSMEADVVLGMPWLEKHNPQINWPDKHILLGQYHLYGAKEWSQTTCKPATYAAQRITNA